MNKKKDIKYIVSFGLASEGTSFDEEVVFYGQKVRVRHFSVNFDYGLAADLIRKFDGKCDGFCFSGMPPSFNFGRGPFVHPKVSRLLRTVKESPILDGTYLKKTFLPWSLRDFFFKEPGLLKKKSIAFHSAAACFPLVEVFEEEKHRVSLADPYSYLRVPATLNSAKAFKRYFNYLTPFLRRKDIKKKLLSDFKRENISSLSKMNDFFDSDVFVCTETVFHLIDLEHLRGKIVVVDCLTTRLKEKLEKAGVSTVVALMESPVELPHFTFAILEGLIQSCLPVGESLDEGDIIDWVDRLNITSKRIDFEQNRVVARKKFAFIIHPLSTRDLFRAPFLQPVHKYLKGSDRFVEELSSMAPGIFYGKIKGVTSAKTGEEIEGLIYAVFETPRKLLEKKPEVIYRKLISICDKAQARGAEIIGLGAYTKIVGDAGVSVAQKSPIPVTTGNSLSACSTLWAAKYGIEKINLVESQNGIYQGKAMVVGATGSIGAVSAKILAKTWKEVVLVAPRAYKLLELKKEIQKISPDCQISVGTNPDDFSATCDLMITSTSAQGRKILDISKVKPGCVICDVSRPFDISSEEAISRPDVMVVASGEVQLPGDVSFRLDMGLEGNAVYACLAETALLTMAGRMESFTLSRNISFEKVLEIDRMSHEHGVRLANIMGHGGVVTDEEFRLCREHAIKQLELRGEFSTEKSFEGKSEVVKH